MNLGEIQIGRAFRQVEGRIAILSILIEILNPYFHKYRLINAHPLNLFLVTIIHQVYGLMARC